MPGRLERMGRGAMEKIRYSEEQAQLKASTCERKQLMKEP